jgi:hypothetical protein
MWFVIAAIAFFSILGRILLPAYHNVFHGIIALSILVTLLTFSPTSPPEMEKTNIQRIATKARRKTAVLRTTKSHHKRTKKRRHRKKKKAIR